MPSITCTMQNSMAVCRAVGFDFLGGVGGSNGKRNASILGVSFSFFLLAFSRKVLYHLSLCLTYYQYILSNIYIYIYQLCV